MQVPVLRPASAGRIRIGFGSWEFPEESGMKSGCAGPAGEERRVSTIAKRYKISQDGILYENRGKFLEEYTEIEKSEAIYVN